MPLGVLAIAIVIAFALSMTGTQRSLVDSAGNSLSEPALQDMKAIAETEEISYQATVESYGWHNNFASAVPDLKADFPNDFSAAGASSGDAEWMAFAGAVPSEATGQLTDFLESYPSVVVKFLTDTGFTELESGDALRAAHFAVLGLSRVAHASSSFDFKSRRIDITANVGTDSSAGSLLPKLRGDAEAAVAEATRPEILDIMSVEVVGVSFVTGGVD